MLVGAAWLGAALLVRRRSRTAALALLVAVTWTAVPLLPAGLMWHRAVLVQLLLSGNTWLPRTWSARAVVVAAYAFSALVWPWTWPWTAVALAGSVLVAATLEGRTQGISPLRLPPWQAGTVVAVTAFLVPPLLAAAGAGRGWAGAVLLAYGAALMVVALLVTLAVRPPGPVWATDLAVDLQTPPREMLERVLAARRGDATEAQDEAAAALAAATTLQQRLAARQSELGGTLARTVQVGHRLASADAEERRALHQEAEEGAVTQLRRAAARLEAELDQRGCRAAEDPVTAALGRSLEHLRVAVRDIDALGHGLAPPVSGGGLAAALGTLATGATVRVVLDLPDEGVLYGLPDGVQACLYYVAAEAVCNAEKHARARSVSLLLRVHPHVELVVTDDGEGTVEMTDGYGHGDDGSGLAGLRQRAAELSGDLVVSVLAVGGTRVVLTLPAASNPQPDALVARQAPVP